MTSYDFFTLVAMMLLVRLSSEGTAWILLAIFTALSLGNLVYLIIKGQS